MLGCNSRLARAIVLITALQAVLAGHAFADGKDGHRGFVVGVQSGYGQLRLLSDQSRFPSKGTFSLGFQGGYAITPRIIAGFEINGWLLKSFHSYPEEQGEAISNYMFTLHVFPISGRQIYLRTAVGHVTYKNNDPLIQGGSGWGSWLVGVGYEVPVAAHFYLAPQFSYSRGGYSDVPVILYRETGRHYEVIDFSLVLHWYSRL
jgi:hypothetical protein